MQDGAILSCCLHQILALPSDAEIEQSSAFSNHLLSSFNEEKQKPLPLLQSMSNTDAGKIKCQQLDMW